MCWVNTRWVIAAVEQFVILLVEIANVQQVRDFVSPELMATDIESAVTRAILPAGKLMAAVVQDNRLGFQSLGDGNLSLVGEQEFFIEHGFLRIRSHLRDTAPKRGQW